MIQRPENGGEITTKTQIYTVYVEVQDPGPSAEKIELHICDGLNFMEGIGTVDAHYTCDFNEEDALTGLSAPENSFY